MIAAWVASWKRARISLARGESTTGAVWAEPGIAKAIQTAAADAAVIRDWLVDLNDI
jgi:hypothetical protein